MHGRGFLLSSIFTLLLGVVTIIYLGYISLSYAAEKVCIGDFAELFYLLNTKDESPIYFNRYGGWLIFLLPKLGMLLNLPFKYVVYLYSLGFIFYPTIAFFLLYFTIGRRRPYLPLAVWAPYIFSYDSFYSLSDNFTSISLAITGLILWLYARLDVESPSRQLMLTAAGVGLIGFGFVFTHPVSVFYGIYALLLIALIDFASQRRLSRPTIYASAAIVGLIVVKRLMMKGYEAELAGDFAGALDKILHPFQSTFLKYFFLWYGKERRLDFWVIGLLIAYFLVINWRKALMYLIPAVIAAGGFLFYLFIIRYDFPGCPYLETYVILVPSILLTSLLLLLETLPLRNRWQQGMVYLGLSIPFVNGFYTISLSHTFNSIAFGYTRRFVEGCWAQGEKKVIMSRENVNPDVEWAVENRFSSATLYSAMASPDSAVVVLRGDVRYLDSLTKATNHQYIIPRPWHNFECGRIDKLNPHHFRIPDGEYKIITHYQDTSVYSALESGKLRIEVSPQAIFRIGPIGIARGYTVAEVDIYQDYASSLPCLPTDSVSLTVSYELYNDRGEKVTGDQHYPTRFERDLPRHYKQGVLIWRPWAEPMELSRGTYRIQFGFLSKKHGFIPSGGRAWLIVE